MGEALLAVSRHGGDMPYWGTCLRQAIGGIAVVFDDQEPHDRAASSEIDLPRGGGVRDRANHGTRLYQSIRAKGAGANISPTRPENTRGGGCTPKTWP